MEIEYKESKEFMAEQLRELFCSVGWKSGSYAERLVTAMRNSSHVITAWYGDNLIGLSRSRVSAAICTQLPYVENVSIKKVLPDRVVLEVSERVAAASVDSAEGRWLISAQGKLLEKADGSVQTVSITGLTAVGAYPGGMVQVAEEEENTLRYVKDLLVELEDHGWLGQCASIDCTAATYITLSYGIYRVKLPRGGDYDYCLRLTQSALDSGKESGKIPEGVGGLLDLTVVEGRVYFRREG